MTRRAPLVLCAAVLLAGCAPLGAAPTKVLTAERTHEYPSPPARQTVPAPATTAAPEAAVRAFATVYINWTAANVSSRLRVLASLSVGQARAAMTLAAVQTARDYELRRGGVANSGTVKAVASIGGHGNQYAVVTLEHTTATGTDAYAGLRPAWHLTLATVTRIPDAGWALSGWQPES